MPNHGGAMTLPGDKSDKFGKFILGRLEEFDSLIACKDFCLAFSFQGLQAFNQGVFFQTVKFLTNGVRTFRQLVECIHPVRHASIFHVCVDE